MFNKKLYLNILIILILGNTALLAADFVVPAIKSPYAINNAEFDNTGDYFAYEVNGTVYIRDSLSLIMKDSYTANSNSIITPFYTSPSRVDYPKAKVIANGNSVTVYSQKSSLSPVEKKEILTLPARVKSASVNRNQTHIAFLSDDGNAYIYDINGQTITLKTPYNSSSSGISFTKDNKVLFADSTKSAGLYSINGQKLKTYTAAGTIRSVNLSTDEETVVISDTSGTLNFYNANSSAQIGYVPNLGSKYIKEVKLSKDSRRVLITGENNTLYISPVQDVLFSQNTVAPSPKQFVISYNALNPKDKSGNEVTEFGIKEFRTSIDDTDAEYILSTQEKNLGKQKFDLDEEKKPGESIIISNQPEQAYFPPSYIESEREALFTNKNNVNENQVHIKEYKQPQNYPAPVPPVPDQSTIYTQKPVTTIQQPPAVPVVPVQPATTIIVQEPETPVKTKAQLKAELKAQKEAEKLAAELAKEEEKAQKKAEKAAEKKAKQEEKKPLLETLKEIQEYEDEEIKWKYKDGHSLLIDVGFSFLPEPYVFDLTLPTTYRNYDLLKPFYFGGSFEPYIGFARYQFPYTYETGGYYLSSPKLFGTRFYAPVGFAMYPFKNDFEIYAEVDFGVSINWIWNGNFGDHGITSSAFPSFFSSLKVGAAWKFFNLTLCGKYDAIYGITFACETGIILNLGGVRRFLQLQSEQNKLN